MAKIQESSSRATALGAGLSSKIGLAISNQVTLNLSKTISKVFILEGGIPSGSILTENNKAILTEDNKYIILE